MNITKQSRILCVALLTGCSDHISDPGDNREIYGEIRTTKNFAALRIGVAGSAGIDSVLVGPGGNGRFFVSPIIQNQIAVINPEGKSFSSTTIKFRAFLKDGANVDGIQLSLVEGALESGAVERPEGSIVWLP